MKKGGPRGVKQPNGAFLSNMQRVSPFKIISIDVCYHLDQSKCLYHDLPILIDFFVIATPLYSGKKSICLVHERLYLYKKEYFLSCVKA